MGAKEATKDQECCLGPRHAGWTFRKQVLWQMPSLFGRLVYVASCYDPGTSLYVSPELVREFGREAADQALRSIHSQLLSEWLSLDLEQQLAEIELHMTSLDADKRTIVRLWRHAHAFRELAPPHALEFERHLYLIDLEVLMDLLGRRWGLADTDAEIVMLPDGVLSSSDVMQGW